MRSSNSTLYAVFVVFDGSLFMAGSNATGLLFRSDHRGIVD